MPDHSETDMPRDFARRIHRALRAWHAQHAQNMLDELLLARQRRADNPVATPRLISNQILLGGLNHLQQTDQAGAELLERRFLNGETALEVAHQRNVSQDVIYQHQRAAIAQLAVGIWHQEIRLRRERARQIEARLEPPTYSQLFGVADKLAQARSQLRADGEPWLVALEGLGGIGKTALADALARESAWDIHFDRIGWVSAPRRLFQWAGAAPATADQPELTLEALADRLIDQFELTGLRHQSEAQKLAGLKDFVRSWRCLVVVDNLETAADYRALVPQLRGWADPTKFLITTRHSLHTLGNVYILTLQELSRDDTLALIRHEAQTRGLHELANAPPAELAQIYDITGGNPLATKLLIGQIHTLSLPVALRRFSTAQGQPVQALLLVSKEGGRLAQIAAAAELDLDAATSCLAHLATLSLVNVGGDLHERRYSLHQLTHTFVSGKVAENDA